ncbi:MAG: hypothetical protein PHY21_04920 [Candidatus Cloacimonetes bacterium]|nr:hypothetical protein [Candidatus Cloacimonadota bacterium]MDD2683455.1 hypothetical protein [Candidatus Cloacimonadota bacterium]MDD3578277.1 hypothetical protein [Candidatus Cloacimonadota bacterium]MDD4033973.1 hypothetical protein [Candidatus Cloacimonadota bacterium]
MKKLITLGLILLAFGNIAAQSSGKDFLLSLAVPGFSQISNGRNHGYAMMAAEATLIGSMLYLSSESELLRDESYTYALKFAQLQPGDYDAEFLQNLGKFNSSGFDADGYNASVRREALSLYPYDPDQQQSYIDEYSYSDDQYWRWQSQGNRSRYNKMRNDANDLESYGKLAVGIMIMNHIASGIDALRYNRSSRTQFSMGIKDGHPQLRFRYRF